jgi:aspartate/methionine/tyrosine aminotransferase
MNNPDLNFGWGDTDGIREIILNLYSDNKKGSEYSIINIDQGYPPHEGDPKLIEEVKKLIKNLTNKEYAHVIITNGATNGLYATFSAISPSEVFINDRFFSFYPGIAKQFSKKVHFLNLKESSFAHEENSIVVIDNPSNPRGEIITNVNSLSENKLNIIWDAAYWSPTYVPDLYQKSIVQHDFMVGSLSKLTGINGIRLGWVATDNTEVYKKIADYVTHSLCGVSALSQDLAYSILKHVNMEKFYAQSSQLIQDNKNEISRLSTLFDNQSVPEMGMFVYWKVDPKLLEKIKDMGVVFTSGVAIGGTEDEVRINLGRKKHLTKNLVDLLLKV